MKIRSILGVALLVMAVSILHAETQRIPEESLTQPEMRGAWIATVANIDWPTKAAIGDADLQQQEMIAMLDTLHALRFNMIVFQVRPTADALYQSKIEPVSSWLVGKQNGMWTDGSMPYDTRDPRGLSSLLYK